MFSVSVDKIAALPFDGIVVLALSFGFFVLSSPHSMPQFMQSNRRLCMGPFSLWYSVGLSSCSFARPFCVESLGIGAFVPSCGRAVPPNLIWP